MKKFCLKVLIEINGRFVLAGQISGTSSHDAVFSYADSFLSVPNARTISLSFPLSQKEFDSESTKIFFDGLLPEGFTRQCVANNIHSDPDDYISILRELGSECLGAIQIVDEENPLEAGGYNEVSLDEIKALAKEGAGKSAEIVIKSNDLASVRLAPCYDVICTQLYEGCTDEMSLSINGKLNINQISRSDFEAEAKNCGLGSKIAMKIYDELEGRFEKALKDSATELTEQGFSDAKNMAEQIINWRKR